MTDPVISPDGKWIWAGSEWIPAPPTSAQTADSAINLDIHLLVEALERKFENRLNYIFAEFQEIKNNQFPKEIRKMENQQRVLFFELKEQIEVISKQVNGKLNQDHQNVDHEDTMDIRYELDALKNTVTNLESCLVDTISTFNQNFSTINSEMSYSPPVSRNSDGGYVLTDKGVRFHKPL